MSGLQTPSMGAVTKVDELLYEVEYRSYDYSAAERYFAANPPQGASCSAVSKGSLLGRNYDWAIGDKADFVVRTPARDGLHATLGVSSSLLPSSVVDSGKPSELFAYVPFMTMDGINDAGVVCCVNGITVSDRGKTPGTNPGKKRLNMSSVVRYVLDYAGSVYDAIGLINECDIHSIPKSRLSGFEMHYLIADPYRSAAVEFVDGKVCVTFGTRVLSNFHISGVRKKSDLDPHSHGIERYNILSKGYPEVKDTDSMFSLMKQAWYSRTYSRSTDPFWYSEYCNDYTKKGEGDFTIFSEIEDWMEARIDRAIAKFEGKELIDKWHTGHCSVYDIGKKTLDLIPNETGRRYSFSLEDAIATGKIACRRVE